MTNLTKEAISHRMLKNALSFWNIKSAEELDPVVRLMLEALSVELHQLSTENQNTHARTLDRVAQMLAPDYATCPVPSRSLLHAKSVEAMEVLYPYHHFSCQKKDIPNEKTGESKMEQVFFTTVKPVPLFDLNNAMILTGNYAFKLNEFVQKEASIHWNVLAMKQNNSLYLGLHTYQNSLPATGLFLYFDFKMMANEQVQMALRLLPFVKCYYGGQELKCKQGLQYAPEKETTTEGLVANINPMHHIEEDVAAHYDKYFITITDENFVLNSSEAKLHPFQEDNDDSHKLNELNSSSLHWLRIEFPYSVHAELLDNVVIHINTFPCINRRLTETKHKLNPYSRIVPLRTNDKYEQFLDIKSVADNLQEYSATQYNSSTQDKTQGLYALLQGGIEKFDSRNAKEHITNLLELLRSESASFSTFGYDFIASSLKELQQKMALIEQKTSSITKGSGETDYYLLLQPNQDQDIIFTNYWCTTGAFSNGLRSETRLNSSRHSVVDNQSVFLVQQSHGGKNRLVTDDRLSAFRYSMLSRNTIVTKQDILAFCEMELGKSAREITIEKGYEMDNSQQQNYKRTIDVKIKPAQEGNLEDWQLSCERLQAQLQTRSGMGNYFRVMLTP